MIGTTVLHYRIVGKLGEGGMGVVWQAEDTRLGRAVAFKVLHQKLVGDQEALRRFEAEARLASSISHPNIIAIYDIGPFNGSRFIAMELIDGSSLRDLLSQRRLKIGDVIEIGLQVGDALVAAHRAGVIHRDVKPENIYVAHSGHAKLGDFGIAKLWEHAGAPGATLVTQTADGVVLGSLNYLSPEQAQREELDARTDIFSLTATLYEIATGERAFDGRSSAEAITHILRDEPPLPSHVRSEIPSQLDAVILKGLEKQREYRYQHAGDLVADLRRLKRDLAVGRLTVAPVARAPTSVSVLRWMFVTSRQRDLFRAAEARVLRVK